MTDADKLARLLMEEAEQRQYNKLAYMYPDKGPLRRELYARHLAFFEETAKWRECGFIGGNGVGKTEGVGAFIMALHLTGRYPGWWPGRIFDQPIDAWAAGDTRETTRDIIQAKLLGNVAKFGEDALGTGVMPRNLIGKPTYVPNTNRAIDFVPIRHISGGWSVLGFKSYDQGRKAFQGTEKHLIWPDEEPPEDVYTEMVMRGRDVDGQIIATFTPLSGRTPLVSRFLNFDKERAAGRSIVSVMCGMDDVPHLTEDEKRELLAAVPEWQRQARRTGAPVVGTGLVYSVDESKYVMRPIRLEAHWRRGFGFDYGIHNTAFVYFAIDDDTDTVYVYKDYKDGEKPIVVHAAAMLAQGKWIKGVGDASAKDSDGAQIVAKYRQAGVEMALAAKGAGSVMAGIEEVLNRLETGRLKVFSTCNHLLTEIRNYAFDEKGAIKKENDHVLDALRYAVNGGGLARATTERRATPYTYQEPAFG
jgi:phage terminase large subunit-like protein